MVELERALRALYKLIEESDTLGLSRAARLRIVAIIGDLEAAGLRQGEMTGTEDGFSSGSEGSGRAD